MRLAESARAGIAASAARIDAAARGDKPVYGVNTGFGKLASIKIEAEDTATLQRNLILSHCCGVGEPVEPETVRLILALKLLSLGRGASGVRPEVIALIEGMLAKGVLPVIPSQGSVGASGDLAPLAHMAAAMLGEGRATYDGREMPSAEALAAAGLAPVVLAAKEGLALINGTQVSTAFALAGLFDAFRAARAALVTSAISTDAIMGSTAPLYDEIHQLRGHKGQILAARVIRDLLAGSEIRESHRERRHPRAGPLLHPLPAAGDRRLHRPALAGGAHARDRGERGDRQPAGADARSTRSSRAATSTPSRSPSPPTRSRSPSPRSARSRSGASR